MSSTVINSDYNTCDNMLPRLNCYLLYDLVMLI